MSPFTQYKPWMVERYGEPLFRIPVQLATACPHGRCAFCSENGSKAQQTQKQESPLEQVEAAIQFSKRRYKAKKFMLYIQAFTADLTDPEQQATIFQCLEMYDFDAISIGTRPDCLPESALDFLQNLQLVGQGCHSLQSLPHNNEASLPLVESLYSESLCSSDQSGTTRSRIREARPTNISVNLDQTREVWVELGVQTTNDDTLEAINRGHDWECSKQAIIALAERGIHVAPHVILGLPGEVSKHWKKTAEELAKLPISGIKIHNLHIMKDTELAENPPPVLNHWEYAEGLMDFLRRIPADIPVMRVSTDTPDDQLVAPHWHLEKGQFLDYVIQQMTMREIRQGQLEAGPLQPETGPAPVITEDGSITYFSEDWKEHYHTKAGARLEADKKFVTPSQLALKLKTSNVKLLDVCFGLGNNSLAALCETDSTEHNLDITALEMDRRIVRAAAEKFQILETDPVNWNQTLSQLLESEVVFPTLLPSKALATEGGKIDLQFGDARYLIQHLKNNVFDVVFHDPFSSQHCPELWTVEFFKQLHRVMKPDSVLLTYSSAAPVRGAMREAGFFIAETEPGHRMGNGTIASPSNFPDSGKAGETPAIHFPTIGTLDERRSTPYRDEHLCATSKAILRQRQETVEATLNSD